VSSSHLVGRYGLGLELRLGRHLALQGQIAQMHRLSFETEDHYLAPTSEHRRSLELNAGAVLRF
jgi:hypothetical protein